MSALEQVADLLYIDNMGFVPKEKAYVFVSDRNSIDLESEAQMALDTEYTVGVTDAIILTQGESFEADQIRHKYPLLDAYLDRLYGAM